MLGIQKTNNIQSESEKHNAEEMVDDSIVELGSMTINHGDVLEEIENVLKDYDEKADEDYLFVEQEEAADDDDDEGDADDCDLSNMHLFRVQRYVGMDTPMEGYNEDEDEDYVPGNDNEEEEDNEEDDYDESSEDSYTSQ
ncbi:unnamed protein product [Ambrosiozyma monospora]|uniref:Unnamed protein product n=1 Tax=Ambrosiozyma monospora TaxID=43982 RepID=A0ACB5T4T7_AMBMO|nr:unnamed protein product [Ambrosiozyma monospora]